MSERLAGRVAVITGSTSGIGCATAERFAEEGATVVVSDDSARIGPGEDVAKGIRQAGGKAVYARADVTCRDDLDALIEFTVQRFGRLDVLMNNAVCGGSADVVDQNEDEWDRTFASSVKACFLTAKFAIPHMIAGSGGSIINTSSVHGLLGGRGSAAYDAAKAGIINLTRQIAVTYGGHGIRANALCPGRILTEAKNAWIKEHPEEVRRQSINYPLGRAGTVREAANAALFLASDESSYVTGHALLVDGGLTAQLQDSAGATMDQWWMEQQMEEDRWKCSGT